MRVRHGFVSNSSSSSFIVAFAKRPRDVDDVMKALFSGKEAHHVFRPANIWAQASMPYTYGDVAKTVLNGISLQRSASVRMLSEVVNAHMTTNVPQLERAFDGLFAGHPKFPDNCSIEDVAAGATPQEIARIESSNEAARAKFRDDITRYDRELRQWRLKVACAIFEVLEPAKLYILNYGDECGEYFSMLEHGGTFDDVPHVAVSNH